MNRGNDITENWREFKRPGMERKERKIRLVSETLKLRRRKLLGHVMRCNKEDPMYQVTFADEGFNGYDYRRVGRPRGHWAETTIKETLQEIEELEYERENTDHMLMAFIYAIERVF